MQTRLLRFLLVLSAITLAADTPADAKRAREFGAEGIGLTRTEHMFFEGDRIVAMRESLEHRGPDDVGVFVSANGRAGPRDSRT